MAKKKVTGKFIAIGGNSSCSHDEFTTAAKAANSEVLNENARDGDTVIIYKKVGVFKVNTSTVLTKSR